MAIRRIILITISVAVGVVSVPLLFVALNEFYDARVDFERFGLLYSMLWGTPISLAVAVWLDYILGTNILRS